MERTEARLPRLYAVRAKVESDDRFSEIQTYLVLASSAVEARQTLSEAFFAGHPHDLCKGKRTHVGLDRVLPERAREIDLSTPLILGNLDPYSPYGPGLRFVTGGRK